MKEDITITRSHLDRARTWFARSLDLAGWLITIGLVAAGIALACAGGLAWLAFGSETLLVLGSLGGAALGVAGVLALLRRLDRSVRALRKA